MYKATAHDLDNIPRVFGFGKTEATATKQCEWAKKEYHLDGHRPDVAFKSGFTIDKQ